MVFSGWSNDEYKPGILIEDEILKHIKNYAIKDLEDSFLWVVVKGSDSRITALSLVKSSQKWTTNSCSIKKCEISCKINCN